MVPGLVALAFLGHALEDAGVMGALPYITIPVLSLAYLIRPMVVLWTPLFGFFALYTGLVATHLDGIVVGERIIFLSLGFIPSVLMLLAWPLKPKIA